MSMNGSRTINGTNKSNNMETKPEKTELEILTEINDKLSSIKFGIMAVFVVLLAIFAFIGMNN